MANVAGVNQNWDNGILHLADSFSLLPLIKNNHLRQTYYIVAALLYNQLKKYELGLKNAEKSRQYNTTSRQQCITEQTYVEAALKLKRIKPQSLEVQNAISTCELINEHLWSGFIRTHVSSSLNENKQYKKALQNLLPHVANIEKTLYPRLIVEVYATLSFAYFKLNIEDKAAYYAQNAISTGINIPSTQSIVEANKILYLLHKKNHDIKNALKYHEIYTNANLTYLNEVKAKALAFQLAQHQVLQQTTKIALLNQQNELLNNKNKLLKAKQSLAQSGAENNRLIAALSFAIAALLAFFGYRSWRTQKRLRVLAEYDYLTKTYNRGHFMALAEDTLTLAIKAKQTASCIMFDLDKFKTINDSFGHNTGDWALKATVTAVKECIRDNDILARLGGEEFVILLPSCDIQAATYVAEKCIKHLQDIDTSESKHQFQITASFGITTSKISGYEINTLITDADKALYQSKHNGRNQLSIFESQCSNNKSMNKIS